MLATADSEAALLDCDEDEVLFSFWLPVTFVETSLRGIFKASALLVGLVEALMDALFAVKPSDLEAIAD